MHDVVDRREGLMGEVSFTDAVKENQELRPKMQTTYASETIQRLCEEDKHQHKQLGDKRAKRLKNRLGELRAVENVSQLQLGRLHALTADRAGQYSVDLDGPMRLLSEPTEHPPPTLASSGGIDWQQVNSVRLLEIRDTHG